MTSTGSDKTILVAGATGTTGSEVARQLKAAGATVRALTRSEESAERLRALGYEAVVGDLAAPTTLGAAVVGVDAVYVASPGSPDLPEHEANLAKAAVAAEVGHFVKLSVIGASQDSPLDFGRIHATAEAHVTNSGIATTFVRPNGFMQNTLAWAAQIPGGTVYGPVLDAKWSIVDVRDVAGVAVAALLDPVTHASQTYTVTGPADSSPREQIATVARLLGKEIAAVEVTIDQAKESMLAAGMPAWTVDRLGELFNLYAAGAAAGVSPDAPAVLGRPVYTYEQFAEKHLQAFGG
jgi:uncharacterized protein YbjT (DUF2867 family)